MVSDKTTPNGYRKTEVGIIPDDWSVKNLGYCLEGNPEYGINAPAVPYSDSLPTYIRITDISSEGRFLRSNKVSIDNYQSSKFYLNDGDIVLARTGASVGKSYKYNPKDGQLVFAGFLIRVRPNQKVLNPNFLKYFIQTNTYWNWVKENSMRSGQPGINGNEYSRLPVPLPEITEQSVIANSLSDTDALIENLEILIEKKQNIKKGVMYELLTPKIHWIEKSIFELADNKKALFDDGDWIEAEFLTEVGIRLIQTGNIGISRFIEKEEKKYISNESFFSLRCKEIKKGDILICRLAEPAGRACIFPDVGEHKSITSVDVTIFRPMENIADRNFLVHVFSTPKWFATINDNCAGSTRSRISRGALGKIKISLPKIEEQMEISKIFRDIDNEIEALEQKLQKYKMIKHGLMQVLLTGKIRLV